MRSMLVSVLALSLAVPAVAQAPGDSDTGSGMFATVVPLYAASSGPPETLIRKGITAFEAKKFEQAKRYLERAAGESSMYYDTQYMAGVANLAAGHPRMALRWFSRLNSGSRSDPRISQGIGVAYAMLGRNDLLKQERDKLALRKEQCGENCEFAEALAKSVSALNRLAK